jgi:hypothetical protein
MTPSPTTTPTVSPLTLLGDATTEGSTVNVAPGVAEAFQVSASVSGTATTLTVYLDSSNAARNLAIGIYTNSTSNDPDQLIARAAIKAAAPGSWNSVAIPPAKITAGRTYWIAVLGPAGGRSATFRGVVAGARAELSSQNGLTTLPAVWSPGAVISGSPLSAYASQ